MFLINREQVTFAKAKALFGNDVYSINKYQKDYFAFDALPERLPDPYSFSVIDVDVNVKIALLQANSDYVYSEQSIYEVSGSKITLSPWLVSLMASNFCPIVDRNVVVLISNDYKNCVAGMSINENDGNFYVVADAVSSLPASTSSLVRAKFYPEASEATSIIRFEGLPVLDEDGKEIAAFGKNWLIIYFLNSADVTATVGKAVLTEKLKKVFALFKAARATPVNDDAVRAKYCEACQGRLSLEIASIEETINKNKEKLDAARAALLLYQTEFNTWARLKTLVESGSSQMTNRLSEEFNRIKSSNHVVSVDWRNGLLTVKTDMLYCYHDVTKRWHEIGCFDITIGPKLDGVRFYNRTRRINAFENQQNAPHVYADGHACLGNMEASLAQFIASFQWAVAVQACILFLQTANCNDNMGSSLSKFPQVTDKAIIAKLKEESGV